MARSRSSKSKGASNPAPNCAAPAQLPIRLRGGRMHNLKDIDLDLPRHQLIVVCGVSGSGKTSLALDTFYAEGQRRYIESFSAYTRQFLQRLDKPEFERLDGLPPAIAVTRSGAPRGNRSTVATATETADYLRLLMAKIGELRCYKCGAKIQGFEPQTVSLAIADLPESTRLMIGFHVAFPSKREAAEILEDLQQQGFVRIIVAGQTFNLTDTDRTALASAIGSKAGKNGMVVVDRLSAGDQSGRLTESLETAFDSGDGNIVLAIEPVDTAHLSQNPLPLSSAAHSQETIDDRPWMVVPIGRSRRCRACDLDFPDPQPRLFNFNQPLGACPTCEGFGDVMEIDMGLIVPDPTKTIREGAIAPWNTPSYRHELEELLALAKRRKLLVDVPFSELDRHTLEIVQHGSPEDNFGGLDGFFAWLERKKYKMHVRVFLSRWRAYRQCPTCNGRRFREEALAYRIGKKNIADLLEMQIDQAANFFGSLLSHSSDSPQAAERIQAPKQDDAVAPTNRLQLRNSQIAREPLTQIQRRLGYLQQVGLGYLQLSRTLRTLSGGENQRVALTGALGSNLVNMLYVLDEPTAGLHPHDVQQLTHAIIDLRDRGNTVLAVEHEESIIRAADHIIEMGPGAGAVGGQVVFEGPLESMLAEHDNLTGQFLTGVRGELTALSERRSKRGIIRLLGASGNNLSSLDVDFPLGLLCLVTGVSGSGKSSLVIKTLYGALCRRKRKDSEAPLPYRDVIGDGQIEDVILIDQSPVSRSPRSNPITYIKAFDPIRQIFADTIEARTRGLTPGHFSFNNQEGCCQTCQGDGVLSIDMQFLADITIQCSDCNGTRYRPEVLKIRYRDRSIADCMNMTVREAMSFFRGHPKVLNKLQRLVDVGLEYVGLGQSATTLSSGEAQRLKLAAFLAGAKRQRTLFILDEPTIGLHFADIVKLIDCFDALIADGHSLVIVDHNLQLIRAADWIIDLGPGAAEQGGTVVATGTPEDIAKCAQSKTGQVLREHLAVREATQIDA